MTKNQAQEKSDLALPFTKGINQVIHLSFALRENTVHCVRFATRTFRTPTTKRTRKVFLSPDSIQRELFEVDQKERISMSELSNESSEGNQSAWSWPQSNIHYEHSQ